MMQCNIDIVSTTDADHLELLHEYFPETAEGSTASVKNGTGIRKYFRYKEGTWIQIKMK